MIRRRQLLERDVSTLLWKLDALETQRRDPKCLRTIEPELSDTADALSAAVRALGACRTEPSHEAPPKVVLPARRRARAQPVDPHEPSANVYSRGRR